jgi:hypothetical protein
MMSHGSQEHPTLLFSDFMTRITFEAYLSEHDQPSMDVVNVLATMKFLQKQIFC